jgi:hypothetical protein
VGPLSPDERRLRDFGEPKVELRTLRLLARNVPLALVAKESEAELRRRVVLREIDPDARIAEVLVRDLEGVAVTARDLGRVAAQPERRRSAEV